MSQTTNFRNLILPALLIVSLLIASCGQPAPAPQPTAPTPTADAVAAVDTPAAPPVKPTTAPTAAASPTTPPPDLPPVAVETSPRRGEEQPLDAPILVRFDQAMDATSAAAAFTIDPPVQGDLSVEGAELLFQPAEALGRGQRYRVTVSQDAQSAAGETLAAPVDLRFNTVGFLQVTSTQPGDGNSEVAVDGPITVVFNRPVAPLVGVAEQANLPQPLELDPPTEGTGEWLTTSIYLFHPAEPLAGGATYRAVVSAGLTSANGSLLAEDHVFTFETALPVVESILPEGPMVSPTSAVTVTFSQPMDRQSAEAATVLRQASDKRAVPGRYLWPEGERLLRFEPLTPLAYDAAYLVEVADTARAATGDGALRSPFSGQFTTAPIIGLASSEPADGDQGVPVEQQFVVTFAGIVDEKTLGEDAFTIIPEPTDVFSYFNAYENRWLISWPRLPQTDYTVTLAGDISDIFGNKLGTRTIRFDTGDRRPFAHLNVPNDIGTYDAYAPTEIAASYRNVSSLDFKLYQLSERDAERLLGPNRWQAQNTMRAPADQLVREWSVPVAPEANTNNLIKVPLAEDGGALPSGVYWVEMRAPEVKYGDGSQESGQLPARHLLIVSPLNVVSKRTADGVLVWATDLRSGQPVAGLPVRASGDVDAEGTTDQDGIVQLAASNRDPWQPLVIFAGSPETEEGDDPAAYGVMSTEWQNGLGPWDYGLSSEFPPPTSLGYVYTDRPIYRPGQSVFWKAILRADEDAAFQVPPPGTEFNVLIRDAQGEEVYRQAHQANAFGSINGELPLDEEAGLGFYWLEVTPADSDPQAYFIPSYGVNFQVAEYRKPEFEVTLTTDETEYLDGDAVEATVSAEFFFGGPVSNAAVNWNVYTQDAFFVYEGDSELPYSFNDFTGWDPLAEQRYGGLVASGDGKTGSDGSFTFTVPADIGDKASSQQFTIDARLIDLTHQEVAKSTSVLVHRGLIYPGIAPRSYVATVGEPQVVDLITVDWDSQPAPDTEVEVVVSLAEWKNVQKKAEDGQFYWATEVKETPILTETVVTGDDGQALFTWTPEQGGQYKLNATVVDQRGNRVRSSTFTWVGESGSSYVPWAIDNNDRIELVADKALYQVGDTARVLVPHPFSGPVEALLTIERGEVIETQRLTIDGNSETLEIPITEAHVPNIFVSVVLVKGQEAGSEALGSFKVGYAQLPVDPVVKQLNVKLTASESQLKPGESVTFTVEVTDHQGNPVETELSLALIDKALLSLANEQQGTLMDTFYRQRGLGVQTSSTLVHNLNRINLQLQEGAKGGGGGGDGLAADEVRSEFQDTALWEPTLVTDAQGRGEVTVTLPDNLTTWRLDGRAVTVDTKVGQAIVEIQTTLPLLVRPVLPRFFTAGDKAEIAAVVNNNTEEDRVVEVTLDSAALTTTAPLSQIVAVPAGEQARVAWPVEVPAPDGGLASTPSPIRFTAVEVESDDAPLSDAVEISVPVLRYSSPETVATAGTVELDEERTEVIVLPSDVDPTQGELRVQLDPSLAAGMISSLEWLRNFPYDCNEQVVSKFLANLVTYEALKSLGVEDAATEAALTEQIAVSVQKLQRRQNPDGGWGWWDNEQSSPFTSAYVVYGLLRAQNADFAVDQSTVERGLDYLSQQLKPAQSLQGWELNQQAFILYTLALAGQGDTGRTVALFDVRERLAHYGQAWLALAFEQLQAAGEPTAQARIDALVDDLTGSAIVSATGAHWEEESADWPTMSTDTRSTALALDVLARLQPDAAEGIAPGAVRWLMVHRQSGVWSTTQENIWSIIALTDWMLATQELEGDYSYSVALNSDQVGSGVVTPENVDQPAVLSIAVADMLLDHANALTIARFAEGSQSGEGQLYYTAHLNYFLPADGLPAMDRGIALARQYAVVDPASGKVVRSDVSEAEIGDTILVTVTIVAPTDLSYLIVESPLPAGAEAVDPSLLTTSVVYDDPSLQPVDERKGIWWWTPTSTELRDEKVVMFATELPAGSYQYTYQMRASLPGQFQNLPAVAYQMYFPEVWGRSAGSEFVIGER